MLSNQTATPKTLSSLNTNKGSYYMSYGYDSSILSFEEFHAAIVSFRTMVNNKENYSSKDERYGHKIQGNIHHSHYVFHALLRNKDPLKTCHEPDGIYMKGVIDEFKGLSVTTKSAIMNRLTSAFGLSPEQIAHVVQVNLG
jgi:hypothetical protein